MTQSIRPLRCSFSNFWRQFGMIWFPTWESTKISNWKTGCYSFTATWLPKTANSGWNNATYCYKIFCNRWTKRPIEPRGRCPNNHIWAGNPWSSPVVSFQPNCVPSTCFNVPATYPFKRDGREDELDPVGRSVNIPRHPLTIPRIFVYLCDCEIHKFLVLSFGDI